MNLFELVGTIAIVGAAQAQSDIDEINEKASGAGEKFKNGIATVGKWGAAIGTAAVAGTKALADFATSSASAADNVDKMSQKIGVSREAYQELDFICSQSGTSVDNLQAGMKSLTSAMDGASSGTASNVEQFEKLGISVTDANGELRSQEDVMWETLSALQSMENQTEKARLATELFGRSGTELMPLLNGASGSIEEMRDQAHDLGLVMSDDMIDSGVELTNTLDQLKRATTSMAAKVGSKLVPILEKVAKVIISNLPTIQAMFDSLAPVLTALFEQLLPMLLQLGEQLLPPLIELFTTLLPPLIQIVETILPPIVEILTLLLPMLAQIVAEIFPLLIGLLTPIIELLQPLLELLTPILQLVIGFISPLTKIMNSILKPLITVLSNLFKSLSEFIKPIIEWLAGFLGGALTEQFKNIMNVVGAIGDVFKNVWNGIKNIWSGAAAFFKGIWSGIQNAFSGVANWFKDIFTKAWTAVKNVFSTGGKIFDGIKDGIVTAFKAVVNAIITGINKVVAVPFNAINGILKSIKNVSIVGIKPFSWIQTLNVPQIPQLEEGGVLKKGQVGYLEGNGDEAVVPLSKNTEWIDKVAEKINSKGNNSEVVKKLDDMIETFKSMKIYLDTGTMVGEMTPALDASFGNLYAAKERGR